MSLRRLLGLMLVGTSVACTAPERNFVPDDAGTTVSADCTGKPDGTECGPSQICLKNECKSSSCGDGFINKATEDCEDGNDQSGDGCSACKFDCKVDVDCKSDNICLNSSCDVSDPKKHICKGTPATDGTSCATVKDIDGTCKAGVCRKIGCGDGVLGMGEDCDDANTDDSDGCKSDCTYSCKDDAACDDGDACTGKETCDVATHKCVAGTPVSCMAASCSGTCDKMTGVCEYPDVDKDGVGCDKDCNDADPAMFPGAFECKDGKDNDCNPATADGTAPSCLCYVDTDKDGYAANGASSLVVTAPECPDGHTRRAPVAGDATSLDCREGVASAFPGQTAFFTASYCNGKLAFDSVTGTFKCTAPAWDYDCDGAVTKQYAALSTGSCSRLCYTPTLCFCRGAGWSDGVVPECGVTANFRSCTMSGTVCVASIASRQQACK
jgi:cysteine-rich repeat protein